METRESKFQSSEKLPSETQVPKFHHQFDIINTFNCFIHYFKICFGHLVLLEIISLKIFKTVAEKFRKQLRFVHL